MVRILIFGDSIVYDDWDEKGGWTQKRSPTQVRELKIKKIKK